jgi:hypothetical protein
MNGRDKERAAMARLWYEANKGDDGAIPLYKDQQHRPWVGLTGEESERLIHNFGSDPHTLLDEVNARLKENNT